MSSPTLTTLSMTAKVSMAGSGALAAAGSDYTALTNKLSFNKSVGPFSKTIANANALGADTCSSKIYTIAAGSGLDVDLQNLTDILNQTGVSLARLKHYLIRLLSTVDDATNGTACTGVSINGPIPAPTVGTPTVSGSGGTLAAGTYYYKVTATTAAGETTASNEVSATTTGSTSEVTLSWNQVFDATGYKVYRGTASGGEITLTTIASGSTITFTDTGNATTSGSPPTANTATVANLNTLNGINNFTLGNGEPLFWATPNAAGLAVGPTAHFVHFNNNDLTHSAALELTFIGGTT